MRTPGRKSAPGRNEASRPPRPHGRWSPRGPRSPSSSPPRASRPAPRRPTRDVCAPGHRGWQPGCTATRAGEGAGRDVLALRQCRPPPRAALPDPPASRARRRTNRDRAPQGGLTIGARSASAVVTLVDRSSPFNFLESLPNGHGATKALACLVELFERIPVELRRSPTWDQGRERARWGELQQLSKIAAERSAHRSWPRPTRRAGRGPASYPNYGKTALDAGRTAYYWSTTIVTGFQSAPMPRETAALPLVAVRVVLAPSSVSSTGCRLRTGSDTVCGRLGDTGSQVAPKGSWHSGGTHAT